MQEEEEEEEEEQAKLKESIGQKGCGFGRDDRSYIKGSTRTGKSKNTGETRATL